MKKIIGILIMVSTVLYSFGQQMPESNLYSLNSFTLNPAYAGYNKCLEAHISNLSQWTGFDGAPGTSYLTVHSGLPNLNPNMGVGGQIVMDRTDMINRLSAVGSYSYKLNLGSDHFLRLGISAGMYQVNADATNATVFDNNDAVVINGINKGTTFSSEFGIHYNYKSIQFGVAVPEIFQRNINFNIAGLSSEYYLRRNLQVYGSYKYELSDVITLQPNFLYKTVGNGLNQFDINLIGTYNNLISLGLGYRTHSGLMTQLHIKLKDMYSLGYAYAVPGAGITSYASGSHEIMIGIKLCKKANEAPSSLKEL
jgi:type IX secretion system PorP/SprF family membrane protein